MISVLYLHITYISTLALELFRGEPAIAEFDWNFSASHNSSANVSTGVGSVLHLVSPKLQPGHGYITRLRVYCIVLLPYSDSLSLRLRIFYLTSHDIVTRRFILQKARHHPLTGSDFL